MGLLGIPVVLYSKELAFYPPELNYVGTTRETYFAAIDEALQGGWSLERARQAYRWGVFEFIRAMVFVGDSYPKVEHPFRSLYRKVADRVRGCIDPFYKERADCRQRRAKLGAARQVTSLIEAGGESILDLLDPATVERTELGEETRCLWRELARLGEALYPDAAARRNSRLFAALSGRFNRN